jgi:hypothetical protein
MPEPQKPIDERLQAKEVEDAIDDIIQLSKAETPKAPPRPKKQPAETRKEPTPKIVFKPEPKIEKPIAPTPTATQQAFGLKAGEETNRCNQCGGWRDSGDALCKACVKNPARGKCRICNMPCHENGKLCASCVEEYGMVKCKCCLEAKAVKAVFCPRCGYVDAWRVISIGLALWTIIGLISAVCIGVFLLVWSNMPKSR